MSQIEKFAHGQFCWVDLNAHHMEAAREFYEQFFGWTSELAVTEGGPPYAQFFLNGNVVAGCGQMDESMKLQGIPPVWNSYINVDDVDEVVAKVEQLGGQIAVPTMEVGEFGRLAFVVDPTGAFVGLWQGNKHIGATMVNEPGSFCWNELATKDIDSAMSFFAAAVGWSYKENNDSVGPYQIIHCSSGENGGMMQMTAEWGEIPPHWTVYFTVGNLEESCQRLKDLGGAVHHGPFETPVGPIAICQDPQGAMFNLIQLTGERMGARD